MWPYNLVFTVCFTVCFDRDKEPLGYTHAARLQMPHYMYEARCLPYSTLGTIRHNGIVYMVRSGKNLGVGFLHLTFVLTTKK